MEKRFENLKFMGEDTGYRYFGAVEEASTVGTFYESEDTLDSVTTSILNAADYVDVNEHCKGIECESFDTCTYRKGSIDENAECEIYGPLDKDINQIVVYYNEEINSAVVFEVSGECLVQNYGFKCIDDLIDDILTGGVSPYANHFDSEGLIEDFKKVLEIPNNVIYFWYLNTEDSDTFIDCVYRSLKGKRVRSIIDILKEL